MCVSIFFSFSFSLCLFLSLSFFPSPETKQSFAHNILMMFFIFNTYLHKQYPVLYLHSSHNSIPVKYPRVACLLFYNKQYALESYPG